MVKKKPLTLNQKILFGTLVVLVISGILVPFLVRLVPQKTSIDRQEIEKIVEEVIEDYLERQEGAVEDTHAESERLKKELMRALERTTHLAVDEKRLDAAKVFDEVREKRDLRELQEFLIKEKEKYRNAIVQRNREIAAVAYLRGDIDVAEIAIDEILEIEPNNFDALNRKGHINRLRGRLEEAEDSYNQVLQLGQDVNDEAAQAVALGNLGGVYYMRGDFDKSEDMHQKSLEINEKLGQLEGMANAYGNLGLIYRTRGELDKAREMHEKALEINEKLGLKKGMANQYGNLGIIYKNRGELDKAEEMYKKSLEINKKLGWFEGVAGNYSNLGNVYLMLGELDKAENMHRKSFEINKKIGRLEGLAIQYGNLGLIYEQRGDIGNAKEYWEKSLGLYKKIGMPHMIEKVQGWIERIEN